MFEVDARYDGGVGHGLAVGTFCFICSFYFFFFVSYQLDLMEIAG